MGAGASHWMRQGQPSPSWARVTSAVNHHYQCPPQGSCQSHCPEASFHSCLNSGTAKCRTLFLNSLGCLPHPIRLPHGGRGSHGLHAPCTRSFKKSKPKPGTYRISFQAGRAESRVLGGDWGGGGLRVGTVAAPSWRGKLRLRTVPPRGQRAAVRALIGAQRRRGRLGRAGSGCRGWRPGPHQFLASSR